MSKRATSKNPYFVRVTFFSPAPGVWESSEDYTRIKAFDTKREAWDYVSYIREAYCREYVTPGSTFYTSIKVQRQWQTLWECGMYD